MTIDDISLCIKFKIEKHIFVDFGLKRFFYLKNMFKNGRITSSNIGTNEHLYI